MKKTISKKVVKGKVWLNNKGQLFQVHANKTYPHNNKPLSALEIPCIITYSLPKQ